jgi:hypothetical protein
MSRARPIRIPGHPVLWMDMQRNNQPATHDQLELLCSVLDIELDDLLDEVTTQGDVVKRLREHLGESRVPDHILVRRERFREQRQALPKCRVCEQEGDSTKHHFVNKWILRELSNYNQKWADRSKNCIPVCIDCHRDLHNRNNGPVSIADRLTDSEKRFVEAALSALAEERPKLLILIARGDDSVYEARLVKDWIEGRFKPAEDVEQDVPHRLRLAS